MEFRDFISLITTLLTVGLPLVAIYLILKRICWISRKGVMSDAFVIWITWLISVTGALIAFAILDFKTSLSGGSRLLTFASTVGLGVGLVSVFLSMKILANSDIENITGVGRSDDQKHRNVGWRNAFMVSGGAALALAVGIGMSGLINAGYTYLFPPADNPFTIYDS